MTRLEDISRLVAEWVWEVDQEGCFTYVSNRVVQDVGTHPSQFIDRKFGEVGRFLDLAGNRDEPDWKSPFRDVAFEMPDSDGNPRRLLVSSVPIYEPETWKFEGACGTARDITELRATHDTKAYLEKANRLLREASEAKSAFLANMSHELRTPLNAIIGFSQMLESEMFGPLGDARYKEYIKDIHDSGQHLIALVNDVLDLSVVEAGQLELFESEVDLRALVDGCVDMLRNLAERKNLRLVSEITKNLPALSADAKTIRQILLNLISNAIKFTPEGGTISISGELSDAREVVVRVNDTGIGIPEEDLQLVLKPFAKRDPTVANNEKGIGLGLAISKSLVEKHEGKLAISSTLGAGTTVEITFPRERTLVARN
jgi:signal transduction histidine kinase